MSRFQKLSLIAFVIAMAAITFAPLYLDDRTKETITLSEAPGLIRGSAVRKSGVTIGEVTSVELDNASGNVEVKFRLSAKHPLMEGDQPTVVRDGEKVSLDFVPKRIVQKAAFDPLPVKPAETNQQIVVALQKLEQALQKLEAPAAKPAALDEETRLALAEMRAFFKAAKPLADDLAKLVKANEADITGTLQAMKKAGDNLNDLLNDDNKKAIAATIKSLQTASADVGRTLQALFVALALAETTLKNVNDRVTTAEKVMGNMSSALGKLEVALKPVGDNADSMMKNVSMAAEQMAKTMADARGTLANFNRSEAALNRLLTDPVLMTQLQASAANLNRTLQQAERIMQDLQVFSDKIARRPELLGVGGALRPSSGLKDVPASGGPWLPPTMLETPSYRPPQPIPPTRGDLPP